MIQDTFLPFSHRASEPRNAFEQDAEASRYALLRRLWPSLQHLMVRNLQPIGMIYGVMGHRMSAAPVDITGLYKDVGKINQLARTAIAQCNDVSHWLAPDAAAVCTVSHGVTECFDLVSAGLGFRGFQLVNRAASVSVPVRRDGLRNVVTACLLFMTDAHCAPAIVTVDAQPTPGQVDLTISLRATEDGEAQSYDEGYRKLEWRDVQALAAAEDVALQVSGETLTLRFAVQPLAPH